MKQVRGQQPELTSWESSGWRNADRGWLRERWRGGKWLQMDCEVVRSLDVLERGLEREKFTVLGCKVGNEGRGKAEAQRSDNARRDAWAGSQSNLGWHGHSQTEPRLATRDSFCLSLREPRGRREKRVPSTSLRRLTNNCKSCNTESGVDS
ncbi:hypothetical protein VTI28DRAFT_5805 [Corynascus sepedonium]